MLAQHPTYDPQQELLQQLCSQAEKAIRNAQSAEEARAAGIDICRKFEDQCVSPLVLNAARTYIDGIITKIFIEEIR